MKTQKVNYLSDLHFDHRQWKSELSFWKYEMKYFVTQLEGIILKTKDRELLAQAEHFQNVFALHLTKINEIGHKIDRHEERLAQIAEAHPADVETRHFEDHADIREQVNVQRKLFREIKEEFFLFITETVAY